MLDGAVDSLRRLLGELVERRLEAVAREVAECASSGRRRRRARPRRDR
jgi:hypothetical protein